MKYGAVAVAGLLGGIAAVGAIVLGVELSA